MFNIAYFEVSKGLRWDMRPRRGVRGTHRRGAPTEALAAHHTGLSPFGHRLRRLTCVLECVLGSNVHRSSVYVAAEYTPTQVKRLSGCGHEGLVLWHDVAVWPTPTPCGRAW